MTSIAVMIVSIPSIPQTLIEFYLCQGFFYVMPYSVYILFSPSLKKFYKGHTSDIEKRMQYHNGGHEDFTRKGIPWTLCWHTTKATKGEAMKLEMKLKNLTNKRLIDLMLKYHEDLTTEGQEIINGFEP